jgi:hypothetical protein
MSEEKEIMTLSKLMKLVGHIQHTVTYGKSRSVLNNLDSPVLAYGVGYAGFVAIYKNKRNDLNGVAYSVRNIVYYPDASFCPIEPEEALNILRTNKLFKELVIPKEIDDLTKEQIQKVKYETPYVGELHYAIKSDYQFHKPEDRWKEGHTRYYKFYKYKNGNYKILVERGYGTNYRETDFLSIYVRDIEDRVGTDKIMTMSEEEFKDKKKLIHKAFPECEVIIFANTLPEKAIEEMRGREFAKALKK